MKYLLFVAVAAFAETSFSVLAAFGQTQQECLNQTNTRESELRILVLRNWTRSTSNIKDYFVCDWRKTNVLSEDNIVNNEVLKTQLHLPTELAAELVNKCVVQKNTPQDTVYETVKCIFQNHPFMKITEGPPYADLRGVSELCFFVTKATKSEITAAITNEVLFEALNQNVKDFFRCFSEELRIVDKKGNLDKSNLIEIYPKITEELIERCAIPRKTKEETIFQTVKCTYDSIKEKKDENNNNEEK